MLLIHAPKKHHCLKYVPFPRTRLYANSCFASIPPAPLRTQSPPDMELFALFGAALGGLNDLAKLPFGATRDPVRRLSLNATWPDLVEELVEENNIHSDLGRRRCSEHNLEGTSSFSRSFERKKNIGYSILAGSFN